jgi:hypothetical protein
VAKTLRELQEIFDIRAMPDDDGWYRLIAMSRHGYAQSFWSSDFRYPTPEDAMRSSELYGPRGPSC